MKKFSLKNKIAVVTGGGSGIGEAISFALAEQGAYVHVLDLGVEQAQNTVDTVISKGGDASAHQCNVANQQEVKKVIEKIANEKGIDILINNAGVAHVGNVENTSEADLDKIYNVNVKGVYNCIHNAIPYMKKKGGVILNMASIASSVGISDRFAYSMSKGAVLTMTYSVAKDYLDFLYHFDLEFSLTTKGTFVD